jgi:hypothetical protein
MGIVEAVVAGDKVAVTTATTPSGIMLPFIPLATHVYVPLAPAQLIALPAVIAADPAATVINVISEAGYRSVHCKPAGCAEAVTRERLSVTLPPGEADPGDTESACAESGSATPNHSSNMRLIG